MSTYDPEQEVRVSGKRVAGIAGIFVVIAVLIVGGIFYITRDKPQVQERETFSLSDTDKKDITNVARNYVNTAGTFGMDYSQLSGDSVYNISRIVRSKNSNPTDYYLSRGSAYSQLKAGDLIITDGPLDYNTSEIADWRVPEELNQMMGYSVKNITIDDMPKDGYVMMGGNKSHAVDITVTYDSIVDKVVQTKNDTTWDGSFNHLQKTFPRVTMDVTFSKDGDNWKVYQIKRNSNPYTLASYPSPSYDSIGQEMFGFNSIGTYKPKVSPQIEGKK